MAQLNKHNIANAKIELMNAEEDDFRAPTREEFEAFEFNSLNSLGDPLFVKASDLHPDFEYAFVSTHVYGEENPGEYPRAIQKGYKPLLIRELPSISCCVRDPAELNKPYIVNASSILMKRHNSIANAALEKDRNFKIQQLDDIPMTESDAYNVRRDLFRHHPK